MNISDMLGKTMVSVTNISDTDLKFVTNDGYIFNFTHFQSCCESVTIDDIVGDLNDLVDSPILQAEEVSGETGWDVDGFVSYTWTYYNFATIKGSVTIRWYGTSNGYYSERVGLEVFKNGERIYE